jgi:hypothetical protein
VPSWQKRIDRAAALAKADERVEPLLTQYAAILTAQWTCYEALIGRGERLTGSLERDLPRLRPRAAALFEAIAGVAPPQAVRDRPTDASAIDTLLVSGWRVSSIPFLARVVLQPYTEALAVLAGSHHLCQGDGGPPTRSAKAEDQAYAWRPEGRDLQRTPGRAACPFCDGPPQLAVLQSDGSAAGSGRALVCATCSTSWPVRRVLCAHCGEEDERRLGYFHAPDFDHVRVDACETCRQYIKTVDLTKLGLAVPLVDEVASAVLDLWARERGYTKVTPNLIGL